MNFFDVFTGVASVSGSTPLSKNSNSGASSNLIPVAKSVAAICLHITARFEQEQLKVTSRCSSKRPVDRLVNFPIILLEM